MTKTYQFKRCRVFVDYDNHYVETVFEDGAKVPAIPHDSDDYRNNAVKHGYGSDTFALCREHEILHTFICEAAGFEFSPTLWAVGHNFADGTASIQSQYEEESLVLAFQTFLNAGAWDKTLTEFEQRVGVPIKDMAAQAKLRFRS